MGSWVYRLVEKDTPEGLVHGVSSAYDPKVGHVIQMSDGSTEVIPKEMLGDGIPTDDQYDYGVELANDIRDHFNATNFMNREWSSYEVQAIGWYRMQLLKSSEGDAGEVANALFEQSRWMGSSDLVPSVHAPIHEVHPWDVLRPETHRSIHVEGARHASDEAEQMSGARVMTHMDADAVVGGIHRPAQTVELATDPTGAEQYLAHYLLLSEQDSGVLMRDYVGKGAVTGTPNYGKGVGISVDIPARDEAHAQDLLQRYAGDDDGPLRAIGSHTFIARAPDGSLHLRTLWEPKGAGNRREFDKVLGESGIAERLATEDLPADAHDTLVDFVRLSHDWAKDPSGKTYTDVIQRGSGKHGVMRTPQQRRRVIKPYERAYAEAQTALATAIEGGDEVTIKAATKALAVAKKEMEVARAAPAGRPAAEVQELVGAARVRVRETVRAGFDKHAPREVRNERERVLGEARDAAGDALGTDPRWDDVLDLPGARGSNGERLYDRSPNGTVRAAITRADSTSQRTQLYLNRGASPNLDKSLLHELIHGEAWDMDDSAVRAIKGVFAGLEGTPYGTHVPGTPLTEAEHEWLVNQFMLWVEHPDSTHPVLQPLMQHFRGKLGALSTLKTEATGPSRAAIKSLDADLLRLQTRRAKLKQPAAIAKVDAEIVALTAKRRAVAGEVKALRATGGLSPEVKRVLDDIAAKAGSRTETRASTHNVDEADMMEWMQIAMTASQRRANDLVNMRGERSALERSINHPFLGLYPSSYMWGKVLPYLTEFLMAKPFGAKAPFLAYSVGNRMHQSFQRQQQYDPELRNYLYRNEPFLRAMSLLVPGLPWDMPAAMPFWSRRLMENWLTNNVRAMNGQKQEDLDVPGLIVNSALYQMTLRGPDSWEPIAGAAAHAPDILGSMLTGEAPPPELPQAPQP
jgi:chorismate mutase